MAVVYFRGDAQPRAQVTKITPGGTIEKGDVFTVTINRKDVSITAGDAPTVASVAAQLVTAIGQFDNAIPEFAEVSASLGTDDAGNVTHVLLTGRSDGTPFTATSGTTNVSTFDVVITTLVEGSAAQNQKQRVRVPGPPTGGTYALTFRGQTTGALNYNDNAATVEAALEALSAIDTGNVSVTENGTADFTIEFIGDLATTRLPLISGDGSSLTGASSVSVVVVQEGRAANYAQGPLYSLAFPSSGVESIRFKYDGGTAGGNALEYYSKYFSKDATAEDVLIALKSIMVPATIVEADIDTIEPIGDLVQLIAAADVKGPAGGPWSILIREVGAAGTNFYDPSVTLDEAGLIIDDVAYSTPGTLGDATTVDFDLVEAGSAAAINEVQHVVLRNATGGSFDLDFEGQSLTTGATATNYTLRDALCGLSNIAGTNEVQVITPSGTWSSGTYTINIDTCSGTYPPGAGNLQSTAAIAYNANAATIQAAIEAIAAGGGIEAGSVVVTGGPLSSGAVTLTYRKRLGMHNVLQCTINTGSVGGSTPSASIGTTTPGVDAEVTVTGSGTPTDPFEITFINGLGGTDVKPLVGDASSLTGGLIVAEIIQDASAGANELQEVAMIDQPTGGTFTLTFNSETTSAIAYNATAATVQAAIEALTTPVAGDVLCTGGPLPGNPIVVEFKGAYAKSDVAAMTASGASLTGANTQTLVASSVTTPTGPNDFANVENYSSGALPSNSDVLIVANLSSSILWNLDALTAVTLNEFHLDSTFTGQFGLKPINTINNGQPYYEYRTAAAVIKATRAYIGKGRGSGCPFANIDFSSVQTTCAVYGTGSPEDASIPALCIKGTNASNTFYLQKGSWGLAVFPGDEIVAANVSVGFVADRTSDSQGSIKNNIGITALNVSGGTVEIEAHGDNGASDITNITMTGGRAMISGDVGVSSGSLKVMGDAYLNWDTVGTLGGTAIVADTGTLDFSGDMRAKAVTNPIEIHSPQARIIDPFKVVSSLVIDFNYGSVFINEMDLGTNLRLTRAATA